ncbi:MAG: AI-2E family transporter [Polyangiales bacterium]
MAEEDTDEFPAAGPGSRKRRAVFLGVSGVLVLAIVIAFVDVIFPFMLAVVLAYVLMPLVRILERRLPRWGAVLVIYLALIGALGSFVAFGVPRLAAEVRKLAHETPRMIATVRDKWVPAVASQLERAVRAYGASEDEEEQASELAENALDPTPPALLVESRPDGSYAVILPPNGIHIAQRANALPGHDGPKRPSEPT